MPVSYRIDGRVVVVVCEGTYPPEELGAAWRRAQAHPAYPPDHRICLDTRKSASLARRSTAELRSIAEGFVSRAQSVGNRCALVARPGVQYGLMRMASAWVDSHGVVAFVTTDLVKAIAWLER